MPDVEPDPASQRCPVCDTLIDVSNEEPLARVACPSCGEKFRVERAFDNFALLETLGVGGIGSVYKARDTRLNRFVALKILRPELSTDPAEIRRLEQEARATAGLANLLRGYTTQARQAFKEWENSAQFSTRPEDKGLTVFFRETASRMNNPEPVAAGAIHGSLLAVPPEGFGLFLFAVKGWQLSDFANAASLFEQFQRSQFAGNYTWINDYNPLAEKFLTDYRVYADWKNQPQDIGSSIRSRTRCARCGPRRESCIYAAGSTKRLKKRRRSWCG